MTPTEPLPEQLVEACATAEHDAGPFRNLLGPWEELPASSQERVRARVRAVLAVAVPVIRAQALEEAAGAMKNLAFFTPVDELLDMTKQDMSVRTCHEGAKAIRALKENRRA